MSSAPIEGMSRFIAGLTLDAVPAPVVERAKLHVLDAITTAVAALNTPPGKIVAHALEALDEGGPAHIVATGARASVNTAAFVNTQMSMALDLGANLFFSQGLGGLSLFGALALAERGGVPGKALLEAVIAGFEVAGRVALSFPQTWQIEETRVTGGHHFGVGTRWIALGAVAANAKLRALDAERAAHAVALAAASVPLSQRWSWGKSVPMAKYGLFGGMAASALTNVMLAEHGFTGDLEFLDAPDGFHHALGKTCSDAGAMTRDFGKRWLTSEAGFKRYPSATHNQQGIHTVDMLVREHRLDIDSIRSIRVGRAIATTGPLANVQPGNEVAAQFSLGFAVAAVALGIPAREWHAQLGNERLQALAGRVQLVGDRQAVRDFASYSPDALRSPWSLHSHVRIETSNGALERWSEYGEVPESEIIAKFHHHCQGILTDNQRADLVAAILRLDHLPDVRELTAAFDRK